METFEIPHKLSKDIFAGDITTIRNHVIEKRNFPEIWAEGLMSGVFKSGKRNLLGNYPRITILPAIEKIFEGAVYKRLSFANEALGTIGKFNGGYIAGSRTSDNIFILYGLIQRQLLLGQSFLYASLTFRKLLT